VISLFPLPQNCPQLLCFTRRICVQHWLLRWAYSIHRGTNPEFLFANLLCSACYWLGGASTSRTPFRCKLTATGCELSLSPRARYCHVVSSSYSSSSSSFSFSSHHLILLPVPPFLSFLILFFFLFLRFFLFSSYSSSSSSFSFFSHLILLPLPPFLSSFFFFI